MSKDNEILSITNLDLCIGKNIYLLKDVSMSINKGSITAIIGPSGSGKSTLLRCINRMHEVNSPDYKISGNILFQGIDIHSKVINVNILRAKIGMVFQKPTPFMKSIYENVAFGLKIHSIKYKKEQIDRAVERVLKKVHLWDEIKNNLHRDASLLSGGQQQKLCIARTLAVKPSLILMDEPCSALDPISSEKISELIIELKKKYTVIIVTHNIEQAKKVADKIAFMQASKLLELTDTSTFFTRPKTIEARKFLKVYHEIK